MSISSRVSKQSEMNEGQTIAIDLFPSFGSSASLLSVNGLSQPGPILDWYAISHFSSGSSSELAIWFEAFTVWDL